MGTEADDAPPAMPAAASAAPPPSPHDQQATDDGQDAAFAPTLPPLPADAANTLDALPRRPGGDRIARAVAKAKVANSLFPANEQVTIGRYRLLELVGSGGMGVVWGAWDPKLERRVAIKLVKAALQAARDRILLEGQALAKLSHPNVVPVFDVGVYEEQVYLVMEWVRGKNLRAYCKGARSVAEILRIYRDAGAGLWAAHQAGLIHRDFKPDNAIVGDDGRVRVLDFGLARESQGSATTALEAGESSEATRGAGTPRYMPPEQAAGANLTPAVDQYAFCASLREALSGRTVEDSKKGEIPRWIVDILERGSAHDPAARYPSMVELLAAIDRDPAKLWRRRSLAAGAAVMAVAAFAIGRARSSSNGDTCSGGNEEIAKVASAAAVDALSAHLRSLGRFASEEAPRVEGHLVDYGRRWAQTHREACRARERHEVTPEMYDRYTSCLIRGKSALTTMLGVLTNVSADALPDALAALRDLPSLDRCLTAAAASTIAPPAPELAERAAGLTSDAERVRMLGRAASPEAAAAADRLVTAARALGYLPTIGQALLSQQIVRIFQKSGADTQLPSRREATRIALEIGDDPLAVETFARELFVRSREGLNDGQEGADLIEALANRLGPDGRFLRALLYNNFGAAALAAGDRKLAQQWFRRALDEARLDTTESVELAYIPMNLALTVDSTEEAERLFTEGIARITPLLGAQHPFSLSAQSSFVLLTANPDAARRRALTACQGYLTWHPHLVQEVVECSYALGWLADERGDHAEAIHWMTVAARASSDEATIAKAYLAMDRDDRKTAAEMEVMAAESRRSPTWWRRTWAADADLLAALAWRHAGQDQRAARALEAALPVIEETEHLQPNPFHQRRLNRVRAELARAIVHDDPARARQLAAAAIDWYRRAGGYDAVIEALASIIDPAR
jgi:eukaryotic-like serine/threonine-protein kinase